MEEKNLRELLEMNKSFSDYFDMIEDRLKVILSKLDNFQFVSFTSGQLAPNFYN